MTPQNYRHRYPLNTYMHIVLSFALLQNAIRAIEGLSSSSAETVRLISSGRPEDDATAMHLAALAGHADVIRYLLVTNLLLCSASYPGTL
jgi:ankyrin repeat protein